MSVVRAARNAVAPSALLVELARIAAAAGHSVLACREEGFATRLKTDGSPVTDADCRAEDRIRAELQRALPGLAVVSEENVPGPAEVLPDSFLLIDPLDGTKDFITGSGEFTVNIALIERGRPIAGVVLAPALGRLFLGSTGAGQAAFETQLRPGGLPGTDTEWRRIRTRRPGLRLVSLRSRLHVDAVSARMLETIGPSDCRPCGSALKFVLIAAGEADVHVRATSLCEWDVAAGVAIVEAAGGAVLAIGGAELTFGWPERGFKAPPFVAAGEPELCRRWAESLAMA